MPITPVSTAALTTTALDGTGVFDTLIRANKAHLDAEFAKNRIKGAEYATVYLGSLQAVLSASIQFLLTKDKASLDADLVAQQILNAAKEHEVLESTKCKLNAEFDVLVLTKLKVQQETALLLQKVLTEKAQTIAAGVDATSLVGVQKGLYTAQTAGFTRDAEQKAAKILVETWSARRMTDEATSANSTNKLDDASVGSAVDKLLTGVGI